MYSSVILMIRVVQPPLQSQFSQSVQLLSWVWLFVTPWTAAHQASLSISNSWSLIKLMSIELEMPSKHLILCCSLLLSPSIFPSIRVFQWVGSSHQVAQVLQRPWRAPNFSPQRTLNWQWDKVQPDINTMRCQHSQELLVPKQHQLGYFQRGPEGS